MLFNNTVLLKNMRSTIRVIPHGLGLINPEENALIRKWGDKAWGDLALCKAFQYQSGSDYCVLAYCEDSFVGFSAVFRRDVRIGGDPVSMGCVGGVITDPNRRGEGYGTMMMQEVHQLIFRTLKCDIGGLLCEKKITGFYERLGWSTTSEPVLVERDGEKVQWPEAFMYFAEPADTCFGRDVDLCGLPW